MFETADQKKKQAGAGGSTYADVSSYLSANKPQGERLASDVGQNVVQAGNIARTATQDVSNTFNQQANSARVPYNEQLANRVTNDPRSFFNYPMAQSAQGQVSKPGRGQQRSNSGGNKPLDNKIGLVSRGGAPVSPTAANNPMTVAVPTEPAIANQGDIDAVRRMQTAQYTGPMGLEGIEGYGDALTAQNRAVNTTGNVETGAGRDALLQKLSGQANPLDAALLGTGGASNVLGGAAAQNADLSGMLQGQNEMAEKTALGNVAEADATRGKFDELIYGPQGLAPRMQTEAEGLNQRGGGRRAREEQATKQTDFQQRLESLKRLLGPEYLGGGQ